MNMNHSAFSGIIDDQVILLLEAYGGNAMMMEPFGDNAMSKCKKSIPIK